MQIKDIVTYAALSSVDFVRSGLCPVLYFVQTMESTGRKERAFSQKKSEHPKKTIFTNINVKHLWAY